MFNNLKVNEVYLEDHNGDTLLYTESLKARFALFPIFKRRLIIKSIKLNEPKIFIQKDTAGIANIQFVLDALKTQDTTKRKKSNFIFDIKKTTISKGYFVFNDKKNGLHSNQTFETRNINISNLTAQITFQQKNGHKFLGRVSHLSFNEKSGFKLSNLQCKFIVNDTLAKIPSLKLRLPDSQITIDSIECAYSHIDSIKNIFQDVSFSAKIDHSSILGKDLAAFNSGFSNLGMPLTISAGIEGKLGNIKIKDLNIDYGKNFTFVGQIQATGLPNLDETFFYCSIDNILADYYGLNNFLTTLLKKKPLPNSFRELGTCRYQGKITGFLSNLVLYGKLSTNIGNLKTDIGLEISQHLTKTKLNGTLQSTGLRLDKILPQSGIGNLSFVARTNLETGKNNYFKSYSEVNINDIYYNDYDYKNILIKGDLLNNHFSGNVLVDDPNGHLTFNGNVDFSDKTRKMDFMASVKNVNLNRLKLTKRYPEMELSGNINANFTGNAVQSLNGILNVDSILIKNKNKSYEIKHIDISAKNKKDNSISIKSDLINGKTTGQFNLIELKNSFISFIHNYFPVVNPPDKTKNLKNKFECTFQIEPTRKLAETLDLNWYTSKPSTIYGFYNDSTQHLYAEVSIPDLKYNKKNLNDIYLYFTGNTMLSLLLRANDISTSDTLFTTLNLSGKDNQINTHLQWDNHQMKNANAGEFIATSQLDTDNDSLSVTTHILPTGLMINGEAWNIAKSKVDYSHDRINIDHFKISTTKQYLTINGLLSKSPDDSVNVELKDIQMDNLLKFLPFYDYAKFNGYASGTAIAKGVLQKPDIKADLVAKNFSYNDDHWGTLSLLTYYKYGENKLSFNGKIINDSSIQTGRFEGGFFTAADSIDIRGNLNQLSMGFLNGFLTNMFSNIQGYATGQLHLYNMPKQKLFAVEANADINDGQMTVNYLNTTYRFSHHFNLTTNTLNLDSITLYDEKGHTAMLNGTLKHHYLKDWKYDLQINPNNAQVLNTNKSQNEAFYGTAYATGKVSITGDENQTSINCQAQSNRNTVIHIPLDDLSASDNSFITFVNTDTLDSKPAIEKYNEKKANMNINLMLDVTPDAKIIVETDSRAGDNITGVGSGNLKLSYDPNSGFKMYGLYEVESGNYYFTLQNFISRNLKVKEGGTIKWSGNVSNPTINLEAYYPVKASLANILDETTLANTSRMSVPVQCVIDLSGNLLQPKINYSIDLPNSDDEIKRAVKYAINSEEDVNRQFMSLLVFGSFLSQNNYTSNSSESLAPQIYAAVAATITAQLNLWTSQLIKGFNWGVNALSNNSGGNTYGKEYELNVQYSPTNRININGNVGYRNDNLNASKWIGDADLEYKLNQSGRLIAKVYTHTNDYTEFKTSLTTQGIGLVYRESFNSLADLKNIWKNNFKQIKKNHQERKKRKTAKKEAIKDQETEESKRTE